jgi:hypothetical protein
VDQHRADPRTQAGQFLYQTEGRTALFYLQGLARIGRVTGPERGLWRAWLPRFKEIEDRLGVYDYWFDLDRRARAWKLPAPIRSYIAARTAHQLGALEYALQRAGWWEERAREPIAISTAVADARRTIGQIVGDKPKSERKKLAAFLRDDVLETMARLEDGRINLEEPELGIHELRRRLRWLPIYGLAMDGKIVLDEATVEGPLSRYVTPELLAHPYNRLPAHAEEAAPVKLHTGAFLAVSMLIAEIGTIKDRALWTIEIERASALFGIEPEKALRSIGSARMSPTEAATAVRDLVQRVIVDDGVLRQLADHLNQQI